jgi:hypothetical protein
VDLTVKRAMRERFSPERKRAHLSTILGLVALLLASSFAGGARAEIPHENYDLVSSDIDMVVSLLNASIRASESALSLFYDQDVPGADQYISMVGGVLIPANQLLAKIENVAGSYEELNSLLPPFVDLHAGMSAFASLEVSFLDNRTRIVSASELENLTDENLSAALEAIRTINSLVSQMNRTIDQMLVSADEISFLTVDNRRPFVPNQLRPLIEKLRELIETVLAEIEPVIHGDIPWGQERAFLVMWLGDNRTYLGDNITGGGYLYYNGSFRSGRVVTVQMDGDNLSTASTDAGGEFHFAYPVPMNASWLGSHVVQGSALTPYITVTSDPLTLLITLIPTTLTLTADKTMMAPDGQVNVTGSLKDVDKKPLAGAECNIELDGIDTPVITNQSGMFLMSWTANELGLGTYTLRSSYPGTIPFAPSVSNTITVTVNIPTTITLSLFSQVLAHGSRLIGNGTLYANSSQMLESQVITVYIDGELIVNVTTDEAGDYVFSLDTYVMVTGAHVVTVAFVFKDVKWRYVEDSLDFVLKSRSYGNYPFWPVIPGWQMGPLGDIPYLFFGDYAYYTWLFVLLAIGIVVKTLQIRKRRREQGEKVPTAPMEPISDLLFDIDTVAEAAESAFAGILGKQGPAGPNERIVWLYNNMISFLSRKRRISIAGSMTHWEVARLLQSLGYPADNVQKVTMLFERALYADAKMSDEDSINMSAAMDRLRMYGAGGATRAV